MWSLLEDTRGAQCLNHNCCFNQVVSYVTNNVIHKSSPTPLFDRHANELIILSQLMNLVARGSVALSIRL